MSFVGNLYKEELTYRAKTVYMYLKDRANKDGECGLAVKTIAKETSLSVSIVKRVVADLIRYGFLTKKSRFRENGSHTSNRYFIK